MDAVENWVGEAWSSRQECFLFEDLTLGFEAEGDNRANKLRLLARSARHLLEKKINPCSVTR